MKTIAKFWASLPVWAHSRAPSMLLGVLSAVVFGIFVMPFPVALSGGVVGSIGCWLFWYFVLCTEEEHFEICRQAISYVDRRILDKLHCRREIVSDIADIKETNRKSVVDNDRVRSHIAGLASYGRKEGVNYPSEDISEVFREIISKSTRYQHERRDKSSHQSPQ